MGFAFELSAWSGMIDCHCNALCRIGVTRVRLATAAAVAPLIVPALFFASTALVSGYLDQGPGRIDKLTLITLAVSIISYLSSAVAGIPIIWLLHKLRRLTICNTALMAAITGFLGGYLFGLTHPGPGGFHPQSAITATALAASLSSTLVAIVFGLISGLPLCRAQGQRKNPGQ